MGLAAGGADDTTDELPDTPAAGGPVPVRVPARELLTVAAVAVTYVAVLAARTDALLPGHPDWSRPWDHQKYLVMADHPLDLRSAPFSWRILEPLAVHVMPFGTATSFWLLAMASVSGTVVAVHVLLRHLRIRPALAWTGTLLFTSLGWLTGYPLYNIWLPDALAALCVVLAMVAAVDRRALRFALLLAVGVLIKEQALLVAPLWYTLGATRLVDRALLRRTALLAAPAVAALVALRLALPAGNADPATLRELGLAPNAWDSLPQDPLVLLARFGRPRLPVLPLAIVDWTVGAFGTLGVLALADARANRRLVARWSPFLLGVYAQPLLASNTKRLVALAFPVAVLLAVRGLARLQARLRLHDLTLLAVPMALVVGDLASPTNIRFGTELVVVATVIAAGAVVPPGLRRVGAGVRTIVARAAPDADGNRATRSPCTGLVLARA